VSAADQASKPTPAAAMAPGPLFVVSMWRSGSSLLYALLNKHPQVALMYEADLLLLKPVFLKPKTLCDWAQRWEFWNEAFSRHGLSVADVGPGISDFPKAFAVTHQLYAQRRGATIWGDKSPNYYDRLNEMLDDFPQARFIIVWRDPKGTANSILRAASLGNSYFSRRGAAHCGLLGYQVFKNECDRLVARGKSVCQVNYEDLILDTASVMRRVCDFLRIPYDESLAQLEGADRSAIFDSPHHSNVKGDKIVRRPRPELLRSPLRTKITGYVALWHQRYSQAWPPHPQPADDRMPAPSRSARLLDLASYRLSRARDQVSPAVFSFLPISLLRRYRGLKRRGAAAPVASPAAVSPTVSSKAAFATHPAHSEGRR
jgi:Sulfotransferase family